MKTVRHAWLCGLALLCYTEDAAAALIKVEYSAEVTNTGGLSPISLGDTITGSIIYNNSVTPQTLNSGTGASYYGLVVGLSAQLGGLSANVVLDGSEFTNQSIVTNRSVDQFALYTRGFSSGLVIDGFEMDSLYNFVLTDEDGQAFADTSLPTAFDLSEYDWTFVQFSFLSTGSRRNVFAEIRSIDAAVVPVQPVPLGPAWQFGLLGLMSCLMAGIFSKWRSAGAGRSALA